MLADEMGLGKTPQAIRAAELIGAKKILVICPACARVNWQREFIKFADERRTYIASSKFSPKATHAARVIIVSFDALVKCKALREHILHLDRCVTVVDEAHYLKTHDSKRTKIVFGRNVNGDWPSLAHKSDHLWLLTGTPVPNNASELFAPMKGMGLLPPHTKRAAFIQHFCSGYQDAFGFKITGSKNLRQLHALWRGTFLRRRKAEVLPDMPPITWGTVYVEGIEPAIPEMPLVETLSDDDLIAWLQANSNSVAGYRRLVGLAKVSGAVAHIHSILDDAAQKIVVFAYHTDVIEQLTAQLSDYGAVSFYGKTSQKKRQEAIDNFQNTNGCRVFVGQITAAGTAINLDASSRLLFVEQDWVPGNNAQAAMRVHRMTQKHPCLIEFATLAGSVDEDIATAVARKTRDIIKILGDDDDQS